MVLFVASLDCNSKKTVQSVGEFLAGEGRYCRISFCRLPRSAVFPYPAGLDALCCYFLFFFISSFFYLCTAHFISGAFGPKHFFFVFFKYVNKNTNNKKYYGTVQYRAYICGSSHGAVGLFDFSF